MRTASIALVALVYACGSSDASSGGSPDGGITPDASVPVPVPVPPSDAGADPLAASFVFVGCNRIQGGDWVKIKADDPSSANLPQLQQTFADVVALPDSPKQFFFTGDLVLGLRDTTELSGQLDAWATLFAANPIAQKVPLVPMVGNHEVLTDSNGTEVPLDGADAVWTQWIAAHGFDTHAGNGPTNAPPNADELGDDQSRMSYSFDDGDTHFVVLNTDTLTTRIDPNTTKGELGWIALKWLTADLASAQANAAVKRIFVFGHKPIVAPTGSKKSTVAVNPALADGIAAQLDANSKVKGYFCAHAHQWSATKLPGSRGVYQIVAGNGGSTVDIGFSPAFYGFTEARIYQSGKVGIVSHQRPVPTPYYGTPAPPATAAPELVIAR